MESWGRNDGYGNDTSYGFNDDSNEGYFEKGYGLNDSYSNLSYGNAFNEGGYSGAESIKFDDFMSQYTNNNGFNDIQGGVGYGHGRW